jgi:photosystem II stability/assembly factor-like uncharacterized protein
MKPVKILSLIAAVWCGSTFASAQTWTQTSAPSNDWFSVASSADGSKLVAAAGLTNGGDGLIYISTNSGVDWMPTSAPTDSWTTVASSADGTKLVAAASGDSIYTSTNSGFDWAATSAPSNNWSSVVSSADGATLAAAANSDGIYFSTNFGSDWTESDAPITNWNSIASSADGSKIAAVNGGGEIWISDDSGMTWIFATNAPTSPSNGRFPAVSLTGIASSADGTKLVAVSVPIALPGGRYFGIMICRSSDGGITWTTSAWTTNLLTAETIASSADGNKLIAGTSGGIYTSTDSGTTWIQETNISGSIACSADGNKLAVATLPTVVVLPGGRITNSLSSVYISFSTPTPSINIAPTNGNLALSWLIPSTNFVLQQNFDLTTTNWTDMTNTPVLNLTNLQNQVFLPLPASNSFYRLESR